MYKIRIFSRHPSHRVLRNNLPRLPVRALIRFGSLTEINDGKERIEINSVESIKISSNKKLMKQKLNEAGVPTARWITANDIKSLLKQISNEALRFPIVGKSFYGSRGKGNTLIRDKNELNDWSNGRDFNHYIFEDYMPYLLEYRLHITKNGCFYTCRKALKSDTANNERWRRHSDNSVWFLENNPLFNKPNSWKDIVSSCVKSLKIIGADILSFDIRVQGPLNKEGKKREYQDFIILETNSASSMNHSDVISVCASKYLEIIPELIMEKYNNGK